ncbi:hypothetical protein ACSBPU_13005 [Parapusillimonas sp. JC17]|uniref:hypothetical protein n=1 Tax=Parapusillimonas sp. JC17 TaxID=3445768 RepID=UPI003F9F72B0
MGHVHGVEQPTTPPELSLTVERGHQKIYDETYVRERAAGEYILRSVLRTGSGLLHSRTATGQKISYDAGDLWTALTEDRAPMDAYVLLAPTTSPGAPGVLQRANDFLKPLIDAFVEEHACNVAAHTANLYLMGLEEACR